MVCYRRDLRLGHILLGKLEVVGGMASRPGKSGSPSTANEEGISIQVFAVTKKNGRSQPWEEMHHEKPLS